ncbi:MAG: sodium:proton antiporter [Elusimicrobia bacterium]|nr:sodium:proton antiporter [Candidatus Liberimonas magnetica]
MLLYFLAFILFSVGVFGLLSRRNLIKIIISVAIMEYAVNLFFVLIGYKQNGVLPILAKNGQTAQMVDPLPQAMVLTTIVIGLSLIILMVSIAIRIYEKYGTFDLTKIRKLKG